MALGGFMMRFNQDGFLIKNNLLLKKTLFGPIVFFVKQIGKLFGKRLRKKSLKNWRI